MKELTQLKKIVSQPYAYIRKYKKQTGKKVVGYCCSYAPEEIIWAAGALPVRLFGTNENIHLADTHLQSYCCSLVRGILEEALDKSLDFVDGVIFPHTCDSFQRLSDIWRLNIPEQFHLDVVLPVKLDTPSAKKYMADVLEKFRKDLGGRVLGKDITAAMLARSVKTYNKIRALVGKLYELRCANPQIISGADFHAVIKAAMIMDRDEYLKILTQIVKQLQKTKPRKTRAEAKRLVLSGSVCTHPDIYGIIEKAGGVIVWDDLCTGYRYFEGQMNEKIAPLKAITARYLKRVICPAKHRELRERGGNLIRLVKQSKAQGVVFLLLKFCDPHAFDYPYLKEMLETEKIPFMLLDMEAELPPAGQLQTRFETFIQIL